MNKIEQNLAGKKNFLIRLYFYMTSGVGIVNEFRNVGLGIFAAYFALKLDNPMLLILMAGLCVPVLIIMGYYNVHKISKVKDWLNIKFGSHYGIKQFELQEQQVALLKQLIKNGKSKRTRKSSGGVKKRKS